MQKEESPVDLEVLLEENNAVIISSTAWFAQLRQAVNDLILYDFNSLLQLLYRVDVSEEKVRRTLEDFPAGDAADLIANLLLERQLQKLKSRREMEQRDENIPEDEQW